MNNVKTFSFIRDKKKVINKESQREKDRDNEKKDGRRKRELRFKRRGLKEGRVINKE